VHALNVICLLAASFMVGCATHVDSAAYASWKPGDPALDGEEYVLSEADFRMIVAVARSRVKERGSVRAVHVKNSTVVEVGLSRPGSHEEEGILWFQRINGLWKPDRNIHWSVP
jgi:hypothetical protein